MSASLKPGRGSRGAVSQQRSRRTNVPLAGWRVAVAATANRGLRSLNRHIESVCRVFVLAAAGVVLAACTSTGGVARGQADYFPGGSPHYDWGVSQRQEDFANVERAQSYYGIYTTQRSWENISVGRRASATDLMLVRYYMLDVRWKLKDGREFLLENIDVAAIMREYFKTHDLQLQWQREKRPRARVGDVGPMLTHEIKDDTVRLKWVIRTNHTPVDKRLTPQGAATPWVMTDEEHIVTTIKGIPTQGIDFNKWFEIRK